MTEQVGRNDPCPCGARTGTKAKKYKQCCGKKSLWIFEHPAWRDDKTCQAVDEEAATAAFTAFWEGEESAGRIPVGPDGPYTFLDGTVYKDGTRVAWHLDHPSLPKLKTCEAATQSQAFDQFSDWWAKEVAAGRLSGSMKDGRIYRATDPPPQTQRAGCPNLPRHRDSKGNLLCVEHAATAEGILLDVVLTDAQNGAGFRCARGARLA